MLTAVVVFLAGLCWGTAQLQAFELNVFGTTTWSYLKVGQMGGNGFFGTYNRDHCTGPSLEWNGVPNQPSPGSFASANGWVGGQLGDLVAGADGATGSFTTIFTPYLRVN